MSNSINNQIPFVPENVVDLAGAINEALNHIDAITQARVKTVNSNTPAASPTLGDRHIVGTAPTGLWAGQAGKLARWLDGYWSFYSASIVLNEADSKLYTKSNSGAWAIYAA